MWSYTCLLHAPHSHFVRLCRCPLLYFIGRRHRVTPCQGPQGAGGCALGGPVLFPWLFSCVVAQFCPCLLSRGRWLWVIARTLHFGAWPLPLDLEGPLDRTPKDFTSITHPLPLYLMCEGNACGTSTADSVLSTGIAPSLWSSSPGARAGDIAQLKSACLSSRDKALGSNPSVGLEVAHTCRGEVESGKAVKTIPG